MKKLSLITTIFIMLAVVFATPHPAQASSTSYDPLTQGVADNTGEPIADLQSDDGTYYDVLRVGKIMEIVTFDTGSGTINHARLHIQYKTSSGYSSTTSVQWYKDASYQNILAIEANTSDADYYYEFPRSYIDTWGEIGAIQIKLTNPATNKDIFVDLLEIIVTYDATLYSHDDSGRADPEEDTFDNPAKQYVYMKGSGLEAGLEYKTAYYMDTGGVDSKVESDTDTATGGSLLTSDCLITDYYGAGTETWKAVVFHPATVTAPSTYAAAQTSEYYVIEDTFTVYDSIPEFPEVMAAIGVAGLCFGIYYWMRKRVRRVHGVEP